MGAKDLLRILYSALAFVTFAVFKGHRVAVDLSALFYRVLKARKGGLIARAVCLYHEDPAQCQPGDLRLLRQFIGVVMSMVHRVKKGGAESVLLVCDAWERGHAPKAAEERRRDEKRAEHLQRAHEQWRAGAQEAALKSYKQAVRRDPWMVVAVVKQIDELQYQRWLNYIVAPREADSQLISEVEQGHCTAVYTPDSDIVTLLSLLINCADVADGVVIVFPNRAPPDANHKERNAYLRCITLGRLRDPSLRLQIPRPSGQPRLAFDDPNLVGIVGRQPDFLTRYSACAGNDTTRGKIALSAMKAV